MALASGVFTPDLLDRDEASYYATVQWYAAHASMPVIGHVGVSYEAQMGPGYYVPAAVVERLLRPLGSEAAFHSVRALGVPLLVVTVILAYLLAGRLWPESRAVPLFAAAIVGLNPHLLALSGAVSNDLLGITIAMAAVYLFTVRLQNSTFSGWAAVGVGLLVGLSIITKPGAISLVVALPLTALAVRRRAAVAPCLLMTAGVVAASGWWFIRNQLLYGELGTETALRRWGFPAVHGSLDTLRQILSRASYFAVSYASPQPTFGGSFRTPLITKIVIAVIALAVVAGFARYLRARGWRKNRVDRTALVTFVLVLATSIAANVYSYLAIRPVDPRTTFASFFVVASVGALGLAALSEGLRPQDFSHPGRRRSARRRRSHTPRR